MEPDRLDETLRKAGERGLTRARLLKLLGADELREWVSSGRVIDVGTPKTPRYVLPGNDRRLERAREIILGRATPGKTTVFNAAKLGKGAPKSVVGAALAGLVAERELFIIQPAKSVYYLHARSIAPLLSQAAPAFVAEAVRPAYARLVQEGGFADVRIDQLAARSGSDLAGLKEWLLAESRAGRAAPTRGDWSLADPATRAAAIEIRGEPHLQIRLL